MKKKNRSGERTEEDFKKQCYFSGQTTKRGWGIINPLCYLEQKTYKKKRTEAAKELKKILKSSVILVVKPLKGGGGL